MDKLPEGFVLDSELDAQDNGLPPGFTLDKPDVMEGQSGLKKLAKALSFGVANRLVGYGKSGKHTIGYGDAVQKAGEAIAPSDYRPASVDFFDPQEKDKGIGGYGWGYLPRTLAETVPGLAMDLGAGALFGPGGFIASQTAANFGPTLEARVANNGPGAEATATDYAAAAGSSVANAALDRIGLGGKIPGLGVTVPGALNTTIKGTGAKALAQIPAAVAKAGVSEGVANAAGDLIDQAATTAGTESGLDLDLHQAGGAGIIGGATGAGIRTVRTPGDVIGAIRDREYDPQSATRVAKYIEESGVDPNGAEGGYRAMTVAEGRIDAAISARKTEANPFIRERGAEELVGAALNQLKAGERLTPKQITDLETTLGDRPDGMELVNALKDRDTLNRLSTRGVTRTGADGRGEFQGGAAFKHERLLNPLKMYGRLLGAGGVAVGAASQYSIPFVSQAAIAASKLAPFVGAHAGLYAGVQGIDSLLGKRNPVTQFRDRFSGFADTPKPPGLSTKQLAQLSKLDAELAKYDSEPVKTDAKAEARKASQADRAWKKYAELQKQQQQADERKAGEIDRAWATKAEDPNAIEAQREAAWKQRADEEARQQAADVEAEEGIRAGYASLAKQRQLAEEALQKLQQQKEVDFDKGRKQQAKQREEEQRKTDEIARAYESVLPKPAKGSDEESLWAEYEALQRAEGEADAEAEAGILAGYKDLARRAQLAQEAKEADFGKGRKQQQAQNQADERSRSARDRDFDRAEQQRRQPTPEEVKAAQEEAMWAAMQGGKAEPDWDDDTAVRAIQGELSKRENESRSTVDRSKKAAEALKKLKEAEEKEKAKLGDQAEKNFNKIVNRQTSDYGASKVANAMKLAEKASKKPLPEPKPEPAPKAPKGPDESKLAAQAEKNFNKFATIMGPDYGAGKVTEAMKLAQKAARKPEKAETTKDTPKAEKPASEAPKGSAGQRAAEAAQKAAGIEIDGSDYVVRVGLAEQRISQKDIKASPTAWANRVRKRLEDRQEFTETLRGFGGPSISQLVDALEVRLSESAKTWEQAEAHIQDFMDNVKNDKLRSDLWEAYNTYEGVLKGTYDK